MKSFAGGLADGINSGVNLVFAKGSALTRAGRSVTRWKKSANVSASSAKKMITAGGWRTYRQDRHRRYHLQAEDPAAADSGPPSQLRLTPVPESTARATTPRPIKDRVASTAWPKKASNAALAAFAQDRSAGRHEGRSDRRHGRLCTRYSAIPTATPCAAAWTRPESTTWRCSTRTATSERRQADSRLCAALTIRTGAECLRPAPGEPSRNG